MNKFIHHALKIGLSLILILTPLLRATWDIWSQTLIHLLTLILLLLWIFGFVFNKFKFYKTPLDIPIIFFILFAIFSGFKSINPLNFRTEIFNLLNYIVVFYLIVSLNENEDILKSIFITALFVSVFSFYQKSSTFINPNILAGYLSCIITLSLSQFHKEKLFHSFLLPILFISLFLTKSIGGFFSSISGILLFISLRYNINRKYLFSMFIILLLTFFIWKSDRSEFMNRFWWWVSSLRIFFSFPYRGIGLGCFENGFLTFKAGDGLNTIYAHNYYLQLLSEIGIFGFFAFIWFLTVFFIKSKNHGVIAAGAAFIIHNIFDYSLIIPANSVLFWTLLAIAIPKSEEISYEFNSKEKIFISVISIPIFIFLFISITKPFFASREFAKGSYALKESKTEEALIRFNKSIKIDRINSEVYYKFATIYTKKGAINDGIKNLQVAIIYNRYNSRYYFELSQLYFKMGRVKEAIIYGIDAIKYNPSNQQYRRRITDIINAQKKR